MTNPGLPFAVRHPGGVVDAVGRVANAVLYLKRQRGHEPLVQHLRHDPPDRRLAFISSEFWSQYHSKYISEDVNTERNAQAEFSRRVSVHFSEWPLPKLLRV